MHPASRATATAELANRPCGVASKTDMPVWTYGIWFLGSAVWLLVAALSLRFHVPGRTLGALAVAVILFAAGMFFSRPENQTRGRK